jgi:hypothetical protein
MGFYRKIHSPYYLFKIRKMFTKYHGKKDEKK